MELVPASISVSWIVDTWMLLTTMSLSKSGRSPRSLYDKYANNYFYNHLKEIDV